MKFKNILLVLTLVALVFAGDVATAQKKMRGVDKSPLDMACFPRRGAKKVKVFYSRPYKKGREVFGGIGKEDKVWRTGANDATMMILTQDATIGGKSVKAGTYGVYTIPGKDKWTIIINKDYDAWGSSGYKKANDVARIEVSAKNNATESLENFSIRVGGEGNATKGGMGGVKTRVSVPVKF